jgi:hypothetical protein
MATHDWIRGFLKYISEDLKMESLLQAGLQGEYQVNGIVGVRLLLADSRPCGIGQAGQSYAACSARMFS